LTTEQPTTKKSRKKLQLKNFSYFISKQNPSLSLFFSSFSMFYGKYKTKQKRRRRSKQQQQKIINKNKFSHFISLLPSTPTTTTTKPSSASSSFPFLPLSVSPSLLFVC
jgi:hypothetical protein